jgi:FtsZ-binding cell division protein ZapB
VKEKLFARGKDKVRTAVDTLEYLVLEFHPSPHSQSRSDERESARQSRAQVARRVVTHPPSSNYPWIRPTCGSRRLQRRKNCDA